MAQASAKMLSMKMRSTSIILRAAAARNGRRSLSNTISAGIGADSPQILSMRRPVSLHRQMVFSSPFSRVSRSNNSSSDGGASNKSGTRPKSNLHVTLSHAASPNGNNSSSSNDDNDHHDFTTETYDFGEAEDTIDQRLQLWHEAKQHEFQKLDTQTSKLLLLNKNEKKSNIKSIISQLQQWDEFIASITTDMDFDFRTKNPQYPPSEFMTSITYDAAEQAQRLLGHLIQQGNDNNMHPGVEVSAYKLVMNAWSNVFHWSSGDRCGEVLEAYGERYGGDMNFMPSIDDYKTVTKAHLKSCSSRYNNVATTNDSSSVPSSSPGETALEILNLLTNVYTAGDLFLKPDVELYSHTIAVVRNTLLDWKLRRRLRNVAATNDENDETSLETQLTIELLNVLEQMEIAMSEEAGIEGKDTQTQYCLEKWYYIIRAYADVITVVSKIPYNDELSTLTSSQSCEQLLSKLEEIVSSNVDAIIQAVGEDKESNQKLRNEIQRCIEGAYLNRMSALLTHSDLTTAIENASTSEGIFNMMKERSDGISPVGSFLFPSPTIDHVQALIRANLECLRGRYSTPESNIVMSELEERPHLKAQRLLKELEMQQAGRPIDGSLYSDIAWVCTQLPYWSCIYKQYKYSNAANSAKALLKHTMDQYSQGSVDFTSPNTATKMYHYIFSLYSQLTTNSRSIKDKEFAIKQCLELFDDMDYWYKESDGAIVKPVGHTLRIILNTIHNSGLPSSAKNAESMIQRLRSCGVNASQGDHLLLMKICASDPAKVEEILNSVKENYHKDQSEKPTTALYSECISAYARSRHQNSSSKAMHLFDELIQLYESTGDPDFCPDSTLFGATINAICKAKSKGDAHLRNAIQLLDKMEKSFDDGIFDEGPNRYAYTSILSAVSQSKVSDGHVFAEDLLRRMNRRSRQVNDSSILPDGVAYTALIQTLARSSCPDKIDRAKKWFAEMESRFAEGNPDLKPNKITYTALINCWRTSGHKDSGEQAQKILDLVEQRYSEGDYTLKPDTMLYSSVIDAWSRSKSNDKVKRAWGIYSRMKEQYSKGNMDMKPNDIIVSSYLFLAFVYHVT